MVLLMVLVGGVTRLTGSGLSMVEWRPLMGALPPLSDAEWLRVFGLYQESPQYQQVNSWMTLSEFKTIFFWEYVHRLLGRLIGVVFFVPWVFFLVRKQMTKRLTWQTAGLFVLGGMQGVLGWYMVVSGLADRPEVSHFRLAAHLSLALLIAQLCLWLVLSNREKAPQQAPVGLRRAAWGFVGLTSLQIVYGAFMAGTRAGHIASTFPKMGDEWFPGLALTQNGLLHDLTSNLWMIHFVHRSLGWLVFAAGIALGIALMRSGVARRAAIMLHAGVTLQFLLGVATVMTHVSIPIAVAHQVGGALLLSAGIYAAHEVRASSSA